MIPVCHWNLSPRLQNFGDFSTFPILEAFGYETKPHGRHEPGARLLGTGSLIDVPWLAGRPEDRRIVWGSGVHCSLDQNVSSCDFFAVRGPLTGKVCGLSDGIAMGDPLLLLPNIRERRFFGGSGTAYMPHWIQRFSFQPNQLDVIGADFMIDVTHQPEDFWTVWEKIQTADFVLTSTLHGAIAAQSLGIPWCLCLMKGESVECGLKWRDWITYLGLPDKIPAAHGIRDGWELWKSFYSAGMIRPLAPLVDALHSAAGVLSGTPV